MQSTCFEDRRRRLTAAHPERAFVVCAGGRVTRNHDVAYAFRADSDFFYLTGIDAPESALVLAPGADGVRREVLFTRAPAASAARWSGPMMGLDEAGGRAGVTEVRPIEALEEGLAELLGSARSLGFRLGRDGGMDRAVLSSLEQVSRRRRENAGLMAIHDPRDDVGELRLRKTPEELAALRRAAALTVAAHRAAIEGAKVGMTTHALAAVVEGVMRGAGGELAFPTIVAARDEAVILHATPSGQTLAEGDLVLVDAGADLGGYAADVTRVFPAGARFTEAQAEVLARVLEAQRAAIAAARPGATLEDVHAAARSSLAAGATTLGLKGDIERWFPHRTSHWIGLDVHDSGHLRPAGTARVLEAGMCLSVEPGLYIDADAEDAPAALRGIGVRIEDTVLITEGEAEVLTASLPASREAIEALRR